MTLSDLAVTVQSKAVFRPDIAVHCSGVTKIYGTGDTKVLALRGVDLDVRCGELLMLAGPSGCGKTTLISIIAAILDQDAGECEVFGNHFQDLNSQQRAHFRNLSIGFVFQAFNLLPALTATENVSIPLLIRGMPHNQAEDRARKVLKDVGLGDRVNSLPAQLSGGQQQRVAIARALVHEPRLIICDEPTSNLDHKTGIEMMEILRRVAQNPERAIIVVTHDPRIFDFADRMAHMDDGKIVDVVAGKNKEKQP
jgi:putative ABC transport system ATP-binding protein